MKLYLRKLLDDNKFSIARLSFLVKMNPNTLNGKLRMSVDFTIEELERIKIVLMERKIVEPNFDIGDFLNIVD